MAIGKTFVTSDRETGKLIPLPPGIYHCYGCGKIRKEIYTTMYDENNPVATQYNTIPRCRCGWDIVYVIE